MKIKRIIEKETNWEQIKENIAKGEFKKKDRIEIGESEWRVLDVQDEKILVQKCTNIKDIVFNENGSNEYKGSDIASYLEFEFLKTVPEELISITGKDGFFLLSEDEVNEYMPDPADRYATDEHGYGTWWWTGSPSVGYGYSVRTVNPAGSVYSGYANYSYGVAPACWLQSDHHE